MRNLSKALLGFTLGAAVLSSCTKETVNPSESNDYFPLEVGKYIVYDVDSVVYDNFYKATYRNHYQMRYDVVDSFKDNAGRVSYRITVQERVDAAEEYRPRDVIHVTKTNNGLEWTQSNVKLLKLVFPVSESTPNWNGLALFSNGRDLGMDEYDSSAYRWNFSYSNVGAAYDPGNLPFYKTATVTGIDEQNNEPDGEAFADRNYYQEIYASGVGLVAKERIFWTYQPGSEPGRGYRKGYEVVMRATEHN